MLIFTFFRARQTPEQRRERALAQWAERWAPGTKPTKVKYFLVFYQAEREDSDRDPVHIFLVFYPNIC